MKFKHTERGFPICEFSDLYGQVCTLQASSLATESAIWLGVQTNLNGERVNERMHLSQAQVAALLPPLQRFAATGELEPAADPSADVAEPLHDALARLSALSADGKLGKIS